MTVATPGTRSEIIDRNLGLELVRVTEAAAIAAGQWVGMGDKNAADSENGFSAASGAQGSHRGLLSTKPATG